MAVVSVAPRIMAPARFLFVLLYSLLLYRQNATFVRKLGICRDLSLEALGLS